MAFTPINNSSLAAMFGGGNNPFAPKQAATDTPAVLPAYLGGGQQTTYPQAMPGQLEAIAAQLSAGFGQPASAYMQQMDALYNPVQVGQAPPPAPAPAPAPTSPVFPGISKTQPLPPWLQKYAKQTPTTGGLGGAFGNMQEAPVRDYRGGSR